MKTIKKFVLTLAACLTLLLPATPVVAQGLFDEACQGAADSTLCKEKNTSQSIQSNSIYGPNGVITKATKLLSIVVGVVSVIAMIIGGFKYVTSSGDSSNVNNAKNTILYAIIGLIVASVGQALIVFVLNRL